MASTTDWSSLETRAVQILGGVSTAGAVGGVSTPASVLRQESTALADAAGNATTTAGQRLRGALGGLTQPLSEGLTTARYLSVAFTVGAVAIIVLVVIVAAIYFGAPLRALIPKPK